MGTPSLPHCQSGDPRQRHGSPPRRRAGALDARVWRVHIAATGSKAAYWLLPTGAIHMNTPLSTLMTSKPACCTADTPLRDVARMMAEHDCGQIPVVDSHESGKPVGVVTDRDIAVRMVAEGRETGSACASDCMTTPVTTVRHDASLADCCAAMEQEQIRRVVVVDDAGAVCGIVAQADVARTGRDEKTAEVLKCVSRPAKG